jgi:ankyrin repeat protein
MNRSPRRRNSLSEQFDCHDYKDPNDCNSNINCSYDYDEKECRKKRSPTTFNRSPYYNVSPNLPISSMRNIHDFLYQGNVRLIDLYPHNPQEILYRIQHYPKKDSYTDEIIELLNYLPNDTDTFSNDIFNIINRKYFKEDILEIIAKSGNEIFLSYLLQQNYNDELGVDDFNFAMAQAAEGGQRDFVERMIQLGADDFDGAMVYAAEVGQRDIVERMIQLGADDFNRAMLFAAGAGQRDIVERMIQLGARDSFNNAAMANAAEGGHRDMVELLIELGADDFNRAMRHAAEGGHRDIVERMIQLGADDFIGAMEFAATGGHRDIVRLLESYI